MNDDLPPPAVQFVSWWESQDTQGLSDACRFSAWNA
jgi:hypothetical protein